MAVDCGWVAVNEVTMRHYCFMQRKRGLLEKMAKGTDVELSWRKSKSPKSRANMEGT